MNQQELDLKLRQFNDFELSVQQIEKKALKEAFSLGVHQNEWIISNEKLMQASEVISIHKHDRFVRFDKHAHDYLEMMFVYSGQISHVIEGEALTLNKGEILMLDMTVAHSIEEASEDDIAINILIKKEFFDWFFMRQMGHNDLISNFVVKALYGNGETKQYIHFKTAENDSIWGLMMQLLREYYESRDGMETAIRAYMMLLFTELFRDYKKYMTKPMVHQLESTISAEILRYIHDNYQTMTLNDMAVHFNYSPDYLGKLIKKITKQSLTELIRIKKLEQAAYLLDNTQMSIMDILAEIGYSNASYFYKQFKNEYNETPDSYRQRLQTK